MHSLAFTTARLARVELSAAADLVALADRDEKLSSGIAGHYGCSRSRVPVTPGGVLAARASGGRTRSAGTSASPARPTTSPASRRNLNDSVAVTFEDGYRVAEIVGTIGEAARPETTVPVTSRT